MPSSRTIVPILVAAATLLLASPPHAAAPSARPRTAKVSKTDFGAPEVARACGVIRPEALRGHMEFLADDLLQGRAPGTAGYDIAAAYVAAQFQSLGLSPAGTDGYFQPVPFVAATVRPAEFSLTVSRGGAERSLAWATDYLSYGNVSREASSVEAEAVFAGFGIVAPELGYDDYAGLDVKGKVVVYLAGAPARFPNDQRAYHSLSLGKRQQAARRGAIAILTIRTPKDQARSPWAGGVRRVGTPNLSRLDRSGRPSGETPTILAAATLSQSGTEALFDGSRIPLADVYAGAEASKPPRFAIGATVRIQTASRHRRVASSNVLARLEGSDPVLKREYVVYSAHLDHLGITAPVKGDSINNGAYDNASGIAALIEIARALRAMPVAPRRSILFLATTAEEQGLEGAYYFADAPTVPLDRIVANVNMDMFLMLHPLREMIAYGAEHSSLGRVVEEVGRHLGFAVVPDPQPEEVIFVRSDQFPFIRKGVPAVFLDAGHASGNPRVDGAAIERTWRRTIYHSPQDDMQQRMDFDTGVTWARANLLIGLRVANDTARPRWNEGDFFGKTFGARRRR